MRNIADEWHIQYSMMTDALEVCFNLYRRHMPKRLCDEYGIDHKGMYFNTCPKCDGSGFSAPASPQNTETTR